MKERGGIVGLPGKQKGNYFLHHISASNFSIKRRKYP